jgi:AcrR family transcriptional regulator
MSNETVVAQKPRRGRPPKVERAFTDTRQELIRSGLAVLTETGYLSAGIDAVIKNIAVPKGSFYHCFKSKQEFGMAVLAAYGSFFAHKLDKFLLDGTLPPLERMAAFVLHAGQGMAKYQFRRGCLVGNLLQESPLTRSVPPTIKSDPRRVGNARRPLLYRGASARRYPAGCFAGKTGAGVLVRLGRRRDARQTVPVRRPAQSVLGILFVQHYSKITPAQDGPAPKTTVRRGKLSHESFSSGTD